MVKNEKFQIKITDLSSNGEGIGKTKEGYTIFVKGAVIGDEIEGFLMKAKKTYGFGKMTNILCPSKDRILPPCPVAQKCGGCQIQSLSYQKQLDFKLNKVVGNLKHIGGIEDYELEGITGMENPYRYRNKAQYPVGRGKDGEIQIGFYAGHTHSIIANEACLLSPKINEKILGLIHAWMDKYEIEPYHEEVHRGLLRHILIRSGFTSGQIMVCLVINGNSLPRREELVEMLSGLSEIKSICYSVNTKKTNVILGDNVHPIFGPTTIEDFIGAIRFKISPLSFFQVNPLQTKKLYEKALEYAGLTGEETVWDMYCGIGSISLFLAQKAKKVYGVEIVPRAIEDARKNAKLNNILNAEFFVGKAEEVVPAFTERNKEKIDVVVVDPPRKGCEEILLATIVKMAPKRMVYVSCDSATLARDLKYMEGERYHVEKVAIFDQFPHSTHVETVCLLSRRKPDTKVRIDVDLEDYYRIKDAKKNQN